MSFSGNPCRIELFEFESLSSLGIFKVWVHRWLWPIGPCANVQMADGRPIYNTRHKFRRVAEIPLVWSEPEFEQNQLEPRHSLLHSERTSNYVGTDATGSHTWSKSQ